MGDGASIVMICPQLQVTCLEGSSVPGGRSWEEHKRNASGRHRFLQAPGGVAGRDIRDSVWMKRFCRSSGRVRMGALGGSG